MSALRIVLVRNAASYDFGGGERFPIFLAKELQKLGHSPIILSTKTSHIIDLGGGLNKIGAEEMPCSCRFIYCGNYH